MSASIVAKHAALLSQKQTFNVVLSKPGAKCPLGPTWGYTLDKSIEDVSPPPGYGIGILTGNPPSDKVPNHEFKAATILAIDIDVFEDSTYATDLANALFTAMGNKFMELGNCPATSTPSGGFHYYLATGLQRLQTRGSVKDRKITFKGRTVSLPIDIRGDGGFIICAPSKYAGKEGHWKDRFKGIEYKELPERELSEDILTQCSDKLHAFLTGKEDLLITDDGSIVPIGAKASSKPTYGLIPNEECMKLILAALDDENFGSREDWFSTTLELIHTFAITFGGNVEKSEFIYHYNKRCKEAAISIKSNNFNADGNAHKVDESGFNRTIGENEIG